MLYPLSYKRKVPYDFSIFERKGEDLGRTSGEFGHELSLLIGLGIAAEVG